MRLLTTSPLKSVLPSSDNLNDHLNCPSFALLIIPSLSAFLCLSLCHCICFFFIIVFSLPLTFYLSILLSFCVCIFFIINFLSLCLRVLHSLSYIFSISLALSFFSRHRLFPFVLDSLFLFSVSLAIN